MDQKPDEMMAPDARELIREAQIGSQEACDAVRRQYTPLIQSSLSSFLSVCRTAQERRDLVAEAESIFLNALSSYDVGQEEVSFGLYARVCLRNGLVSAVRHMETLHRLPIVSLGERSETERTDIAADVAADESFAVLCRLVRGSLSEYENRVWWAFVAGTPVAQIAASLGKDEKSVYNAIFRIRRKLRCRLSQGT